MLDHDIIRLCLVSFVRNVSWLFLFFCKCSFFWFIWNIIVLNHPFFPSSSLCSTNIRCVKLRLLLHSLSHTPLCALPHYDRGDTHDLLTLRAVLVRVIIPGRVPQGELSPFERALWIGQVILYFLGEKSSGLTYLKRSNSHNNHISFTSVSLLKQIW